MDFKEWEVNFWVIFVIVFRVDEMLFWEDEVGLLGGEEGER